MDSSQASTVHTIHDATVLKSLPSNINEVYKRAGAGNQHPKAGWIVAFNVQKRLFSFSGNTLSRLFCSRYRIVNTRKEALEFLMYVDVTLSIPKDILEAEE